MATIELIDPLVADAAEAAADKAAQRAGVLVHLVQDQEDVDALNNLLFEVWGGSEDSLMPAALTRAFIHAGNYVSGAVSQGKLIGASVGFLGWRDQHVHLHSHVTGVAPSMQGRSVGYALKQHQRAWALRNGLREIIWTFDPLIPRNGYFNVMKLGAEIIDFKPNFYGEMTDGLNSGDESDRCVIRWQLDSDRAMAAAEGQHIQDVDTTGVGRLVAQSSDGDPIIDLTPEEFLEVFVPPDILKLRRSAPEIASKWRSEVRRAFSWAFAEGYRVTAVTRSGSYILGRA